MENKLIKSLKIMIDDLSSIEAATVLNDENQTSVIAYSKIQIEGDHLAVVFSENEQLLSIQKESVQGAQRLRALTIDLISGIIHNL
jgi:hypothetical protein